MIGLFLYNVFLVLYFLAVKVYSIFNAKAKKWVNGRNEQRKSIEILAETIEPRIWIHCSSLGEFEQGRPFIETIKKEYPKFKIVLTFFSPSGYEACKAYKNADYIFYLPMDGKINASNFIAAVKPSLAVFVKYEFWYYYLIQLHKEKIPSVLISGAFREGQSFFKWYGSFFRKMLKCFDFLFVQDEEAKRLLKTIRLDTNVIVAGDTRYDRVAAISSNVKLIPLVESFKDGKNILIAGSTWPDDEKLLKDCLATLPENWKMIIAPHEIDKAHVQKILELFGDGIILFSQLADNKAGANKRILVIDNIGMLSSLYSYGDITFIGGGFQKGGIHNILEPAVFGLPVIFGPIYGKFVEANVLVRLGYAFPVKNARECDIVLQKLISDIQYRTTISDSLKAFMMQHIGATEAILDRIESEKWLNN